MRVLTVVDDLGPGGTQRVAVQTACKLKERGVEVAILTRKGSGPRKEQLDEAGIDSFLADHIDDPFTSPHITAARDWAPHIIHAHKTGHTNPHYSALLRFLKDGNNSVKIVEHSHFGRCDRSPDADLIDLHIQISLWCHWRWDHWTRGLNPKPLGVYIPHMIDATRFSRASQDNIDRFRKDHKIPDGAFVFGYLAQGHAVKWSSNLFDSFHEVAQKNPRAVLMIAGIKETSKHLYNSFPDQIKDRIIELPFIHGDEALALAYSAMDTFVLATSIGETFGLVAAEAMCCNTPVVTMTNPTRGSGQAEVVGHQQGGLIAANKPAVAEAMQTIMHDRSLRERCKSNGRKRIINRYEPDQITNQLITLFNIVHQSESGEALRSTLNTEKSMQTRTTTQDLNNAWGGMIGTHPFKQRIIQRFVLSPKIQSLWNSIRHKNTA